MSYHMILSSAQEHLSVSKTSKYQHFVSENVANYILYHYTLGAARHVNELAVLEWLRCLGRSLRVAIVWGGAAMRAAAVFVYVEKQNSSFYIQQRGGRVCHAPNTNKL